MVKIYCHGVHKNQRENFCPECRSCATILYRLDHCRWGNEKISAPSARAISKPAMREKIRAVMLLNWRIMLYHRSSARSRIQDRQRRDKSEESH